MTCRDCIHNEVCSTYIQAGYGGDVCPHFADKSQYIKLPCKVGDTVYAVKGCFYLPHATHIHCNELIVCEIIVIKQTKKGKFILLKPLLEETFGMRSSNGWFPVKSIGKTVFLDRESAEKALREVKENDDKY